MSNPSEPGKTKHNVYNKNAKMLEFELDQAFADAIQFR